MKRGLLVAALVLVPFAALVALGFYFSEDVDTPRARPEEQRLLTVPTVTVIPHPAIEDAGVTAAPVLPTLIAPLEPQVRRCFTDTHVTGRIHIAFTPQRDGGFGSVIVDHNSTQSPYLAACVEDVLQGAAFQPSPGPEYERVDFTFSF